MLGCKHPLRGAAAATLGFCAAIVALMILIAVPVVRHARAGNHARTCIDNLATLLAATERYTLDHDLKKGATVSIADLTAGTTPTLAMRPICPDGGQYTLNAAGELPTCSQPGHVLPMASPTRLGAATDSSATTATAAAR